MITSTVLSGSGMFSISPFGLVEEAYRTAETAGLGPRGTEDDIMGPDGYRTGLLFHAGMPELRNDPRSVPLCARLALVEFWLATGKWPDCVDDVPYDFKARVRESARGSDTRVQVLS
jgi:hypothetical protein